MNTLNKAISIALIPILIVLISLAAPCKTDTETNIQSNTEIYIINGDHEGSGWFEGPSKTEFLKALMSYPEHLFITPSLWKSFCSHRAEQMKHLTAKQISPSLDNLEITQAKVYNKDNKKSFSQDDKNFFNIATVVAFDESEWDFYDTNIGLYYLRPKYTNTDIGLKLELCTKITDPCALNIKKTEPGSWAEKFITLFDLTQWNKAHQNGKKKVVCFSGHGTQSSCKVSRACGVPTESFIMLMNFFNDSLKINTVGIQSCYWPSTRILKLMAGNGKPQLNFQLVTPIDQERALYFNAEMPIVWSYEPTSRMAEIQEISTGDIFLNGLHEIADSFAGTMTKELTEKINNIDVVQVNHNYHMKTGLIDAGASHPILI